MTAYAQLLEKLALQDAVAKLEAAGDPSAEGPAMTEANKSDVAGHEFHGNQYTADEAASLKEAKASADEALQANHGNMNFSASVTEDAHGYTRDTTNSKAKGESLAMAHDLAASSHMEAANMKTFGQKSQMEAHSRAAMFHHAIAQSIRARTAKKLQDDTIGLIKLAFAAPQPVATTTFSKQWTPNDAKASK